jgi:AbrB family looped-hinge helix DNA binding protein
MSLTEIDANGRIRLPMGIRDRLDLNEGDKLAIDQLGDGTIILKKLAKRMSLTISK